MKPSHLNKTQDVVVYHGNSQRPRKAIRNMLDADKFDDTIFGSHAQQAVEKLFKAWLSLRGVAYPRTHDLKVLYQLLEDQQEGGLETFAGLIDLTGFAVQFRYESATDLEPIDRPDTVRAIDRLFAYIENLVQPM
jgi:HEPN domain-containing protein